MIDVGAKKDTKRIAKAQAYVRLNGEIVRLIRAGKPHEVFTEANLQQAFSGQMVVVDGRIIVVDQCCGGERGDRQ